MDHYKGGFFNTRTIISLAIIAAGIILLAENLGMDIPINVWEWWPLILIFIGIGQLMRPSAHRQPMSGIILIFVGLVFMGNTLDLFYFNFGDLWPVFLILAGLSMLSRHSWKKNNDISDQDMLNLSMFLGGGEYRFTTKRFKGGKISAIMGGGTLDLTETEMEMNEVEIDVFALMGGLEVRIPKHWHLNVKASPILGGVEDKTFSAHMETNSPDFPEKGKRLTLTGTLIMGGLEVRN